MTGTPPRELAVLGGAPAFAAPLHVGRPNLGDRERLLERMRGVLDRAWLTNDGPLVGELEREVAAIVGVRHCVATCNGTLALEIALRAANLEGEVIVPSFTFVATAHALAWTGLTPVFCDVDPATHNLDPARVAEAIGPRTAGILGVHLWGRPCPVEELEELATRFDLTLLFDAAHAFDCSHRGRMLGSFGRAEVLSFHATKFVNAFEGGAIVTDDAELAARARLLRNFGFADYDEVTELGTNGKMTEPSAAMALTSLESRDSFRAANRHNHEAYRAGLADVPGVEPIAYDERERGNRQYAVIEVDEAAGLTRDELQRALWAENVLARRYFFPGCHRMEPYRSRSPEAGERLPATEGLARRVLALPTGTAMGEEEVDRVCALIRRALAEGPRVRRALVQAR